MSLSLVSVFCCFVVIAKAIREGSTTDNSPSYLKTLLEGPCGVEYSATCLKADVAALVPVLSSPRSFRILPSLVLEMGGFPVSAPKPVARDASSIDDSLDRFIVKGMDGFINSLALRVKVVDKSVADALKKVGITFAQEMLLPDLNSTSRDITGRRKKLNYALVMGGMVSAGTLLALTMSAVSTMAGKAILVSLISLLLSLLNGRNSGSSSSGGKVSYEVVHAVPQHDDHFSKTWGQNDLLEDSSIHHLAKPILSHVGGKRIDIVSSYP